MAALASDWLRHFRLLLWNRWTEFNDRKQDLNLLYQVCVFRTDRKNKVTALAFDWLRHLRLLLWNRWIEFNETWQEASSQSPLPSLCFFWPIVKTRWSPRPLIGWDIFDFSSETAERNSRKHDRKQDINVLYQVSVFRADQKKKMAAPPSDWLRHFRLLLWNRLTEFNETSSSSFLLPSSCWALGRTRRICWLYWSYLFEGLIDQHPYSSIIDRPCLFKGECLIAPTILSAPEPKAQVHYCDHALSVVRPSVRR